MNVSGSCLVTECAYVVAKEVIFFEVHPVGMIVCVSCKQVVQGKPVGVRVVEAVLVKAFVHLFFETVVHCDGRC